MKSTVLTLVLSLLLFGCGGEGGDSEPAATTPTITSYSTTSPDTNDVGESQKFDLTGTASANGVSEPISGSYTETHKPNQQEGGEEVQVYDSVFVITVPSQGISISSSATTYLKMDGTIIFQRMDTGVECYPSENYSNVPSSVKIGESGVLGSAVCSDGTTLSGSYIVEQSDRNTAWAVIRVFATYSATGQADIYEDIASHISADGRIHVLELTAGDGEFSFELSS